MTWAVLIFVSSFKINYNFHYYDYLSDSLQENPGAQTLIKN
jgi:hypothetical protein